MAKRAWEGEGPRARRAIKGVYSSDMRTQIEKTTTSANQRVTGFTEEGGNAIRKVLKANRITRIAKMHTRWQNNTVTKATAKGVADEVRELKEVMAQQFTALGERDGTDSQRWTGSHTEWRISAKMVEGIWLGIPEPGRKNTTASRP